MLKDNPVVSKLMATGEERMGKLAQQLLSNEKFVNALQKVIVKSLAAKGQLDKSIGAALGAMNVPSTRDLAELKDRQAMLEKALAAAEDRLTALEAKKK